MIPALKKYAVLSDVIERCNRVVLDTLAHNTIQEAAIAIESFNNGGKRLLCLESVGFLRRSLRIRLGPPDADR